MSINASQNVFMKASVVPILWARAPYDDHHKQQNGNRVLGQKYTKYQSLPLHNSPPGQHDEDKEGLCIFFALITVLILLGLALSIFNIVSTALPCPLTFRVDSLSVSPFNISPSHVTAHWDIAFSVFGTFHLNEPYYCEDANVSVLYKEQKISSSMIRPFLKKGAVRWTTVRADINVVSDYINGSISDAIVEDWRKGMVAFTVELKAMVRSFDHDKDKEERMPLAASCEKVMVVFSSDDITSGIMFSDPIVCNTQW